MDRNKQVPGRPKSKITPQPPDTFIALGSKPSGSRDIEAKWSAPLSKPVKVVPTTERKREATTSQLSVVPPKKIKVPVRPTVGPGPSVPTITPEVTTTAGGVEIWDSLCLEQEPAELLTSILENIQSGNIKTATAYILGGIRLIKTQRYKLCKMTYNSLLLACQSKPSLFTNEHVVTAIVSLIRRDVTSGLKNAIKNVVYNHILFINLLLHAFENVTHWPDVFIKLYAEDAVGDRVWIDNPYCKPFVDNIVTAFNTKSPPRALLASETWMSAQRDTGSPLTINLNDDDEALSEHKLQVDTWNIKVYPRYTQSADVVEQIALEVIKEQLTRRQQPDAITKNFVRFLSITCGLVEIRVIAVARIETWLHNHKLMKPSQELLAYLCFNCVANTHRDLEVVSSLSKLRLKNKPMVNFFNNCLKEMVVAFPENLNPLLKSTIYNELANSRNSNNLFVVGAMFQVLPDASAEAFAGICIELFLNKDDYLRSLRALLKEINRVLRHDFNLLSVVHSLLRERKELAATIRESEFRERIFLSVADLVCMCMLLCVSPQVRDSASQSKRDVNVLKVFQAQVSNIQREAVTWLQDSCLRTYRPNVNDFQHVLHKVVFLEQAEHYYKVDSWPGENERNLFLRLSSEVPLLQTTLLRILLMGISKEHPIGPNEIIEIADQLIKRAATLPSDCLPPLEVDKIEIVNFFFNLCTYNYPENIGLPTGYVPPKLAITAMYWKCWPILLILAAHNPGTVGSWAWEKYPILRMFMEMCITNHFSYPPATLPASDSASDDPQTKELQLLTLERPKILEFESHLAAASTKAEINEQTSLLLPQLMEMQPHALRRPPPAVLDALQTLNNSHRLGHMLCRSRNPDFLLDIMTRQGGTGNMPWLAELVHSSEGALAHLPVQCLCEYMLSTVPTEKLTKHTLLLGHLRTVANGDEPQTACEVLEYLLRRLTALYSSSRAQAIKALTLILAPATDEHDCTNAQINNTHWLTQYIQTFPHYHTVKPLLVQFLRQAILIETNPVHMSNYVEFLATNGLDDSVDVLEALVYDLASIIVERSSITSYILPGINNTTVKTLIEVFAVFLTKARTNTDNSFHWSENQDQVIVTWSNNEQCTLQILIVHASIVLLTYGPLPSYEPYERLLEIWLPEGEESPKAYLVDTSEEALLVPDWLKLRMIRSNVPKLLESAVEKLEAPQLVLFIQSFGIPVVSISKLLQMLDRVTTIDPKLVVDSVLDKNYMIQLVEVQNRRGATGGEVFVRALELQVPQLVEEMDEGGATLRLELPGSVPKRGSVLRMSGQHELYNHIKRMFDVSSGDILPDVKAVTKIIATSTDNTLINQLIDFIQAQIPISTLLNTCAKHSSTTIIFRLLLNRKTANIKSVQFAQNVMAHVENKTTAIHGILKEFLDENEKLLSNAAMEVENSTSTEVVIKRRNVLDNAAELGEKLGELLLENSDTERCGLLVDWLSAVELEIANFNSRHNQLELIFSRRKFPFRPLLMSIVLQRAGWHTLNGIVDYLLVDAGDNICPISALDFLTALTESPRLWQGRDKAVPKHARPESVLHLNLEKLLSLVKYILAEASLLPTSQFPITMQSRISLLLSNLSSSTTFHIPTKPIIEYLTKLNTPFSQHLLLLIYMSLPSITNYLDDTSKLFNTEDNSISVTNTEKDSTNSSNLNTNSDSVSKTAYTSTVDVISHCLISALTVNTSTNAAARSTTKDWTRKSQDWELCARKLAATHPDLFLRQLPMLAVCLRGRPQYDWSVLKGRGHFMLFGQVLGLLELLQPAVYRQTEQLCSLLDSYFLLLQFHGHYKDMNVLVSRLVVFLQNWIVKDVKAASIYLQQHGDILHDLQHSQPSLNPLLSTISLPTHHSAISSTPTTSSPISLDTPPPNWTSLTDTLRAVTASGSTYTVVSTGGTLDPVHALQEIEHVTTKRPHLLVSIAQVLLDCLASGVSQQVRVLALSLVVRYLRHDPNGSSRALPTILTCLDSEDPEVVSCVLERLAEIVVVMQEYAQLILTRVFKLGVNSNINTGLNISRSIAMLSLQNGA